MTNHTQDLALTYLIEYFNGFDELELQSHDALSVSEVWNILGYASFEDESSIAEFDIQDSEDFKILKNLRDKIQELFYWINRGSTLLPYGSSTHKGCW